MNSYEIARAASQRQALAQCSHFQEEKIAQHYASFAHLAAQLRMLCEERKHTGTTKLDDAIKYLTGKIREGHLLEFGIELEWNKPSDQR